MKKTLLTILRIIVQLALLYGVYTETGVWTTLTIGLMFVAFEGVLVGFERKKT